MKKITVILIGLLMAAALFTIPVMASVNQDANGNTVGGHNNNQVNQNTNYDTETNQNAVSLVSGHDNSVTTTNNNVNTQGGNIVNGATAVSNNQQVSLIIESNPNHYRLDTGLVTTQTTSLYGGEVLVFPIDGGADTPSLQLHGEKYHFVVQSALPTLVYVINSNDDDKVTSLSGAPNYDPVRKKFDHSNVFVYQTGKFRSTQQALDFTVKESGRYSFVIDTRVSQQLNAELSQITPNSVDIVYSLEKSGGATPLDEMRTYYGKSEVFVTLPNGMADNSKDLILRSF